MRRDGRPRGAKANYFHASKHKLTGNLLLDAQNHDCQLV